MPVRRGVAGPGTMVVVIAALVLTHFATPASAVSTPEHSSLSAVPDTHSARSIQRRRLINHLLDLADTAAARGDRRAAEGWRRAARRLECRFFGCPPPSGQGDDFDGPDDAGRVHVDAMAGRHEAQCRRHH